MKQRLLFILCLAFLVIDTRAQSSLFTTEFLDTSSTRNMDVAMLENGHAVVVGHHHKKAAVYTMDTATGAILSAYSLGFTRTTFNTVAVAENRIYVAGSCMDSLNCGIVVALDSAFNVLWSRKFYYGGEVFKVYATPDNGCICVAGPTSWIVRMSPTGVVKWARSYTDLYGHNLAFFDTYVSKEWNVVLVGRDVGSSSLMGAVVLVLDSSGNMLWDQIYTNPALEMFPWDITEGYNSDIIITGTARAGCSSNEMTSNFILRLTDTGAVRWAIQYSIPLNSPALCQPTQDVIEVDGIIYVAQSRTNYMSPITSYCGWIMSVNPFGQPASIRFYNNITDFTGMCQAGNSLLVSGYHQEPGMWTEHTTSWLVKTDKQGSNGCMDIGGSVTTCPFTCAMEPWCLPQTIPGPLLMTLTLVPDSIPFSLCVSSSVGEHTQGSSNIYPNPFSSQAIVSVPDAFGEEASVELFDANGRLCYALRPRPGTKEFTLERNGLSTGIYLLCIMNEGVRTTTRIVITD